MAFPDDFEVPQDQGGPGQGDPVGGFGGNPQKGQDDHRAVVRSAGKAPVILIHGNAGSADIAGDKWNMSQLRERLVSNGYPRELVWALSYLGTSPSEQARFDDGGFGPQPPTPHTNNVNEVREFIDNVCEYMGVDFVDIIAHSLGCTLAYSILRGLNKQGNFDHELKRWNRVGTFVALAGAFRGLTSHTRGEWVPNGKFINELRKEDLSGGGETPFREGKPKTPGPSPHNITYFCGIAEQDFIDAQSPAGPLRTGFLEGAINEGEFLGFQLTGHEAIIKNEAFFNEFLQHLNRVPPVPRATITVDKDSGNYDSPLTITLNIDPSDKIVDYVAKRVTKEIRNNVLGDEIAETLNGSLNSGQTLTLPTDGMWEVVFTADGADDLKRTYGVGIEMIEVTITTDNSIPFEESLNVMATTTRGKLYHSDDGLAPQMWLEGANITVTEGKVIYFIAIDSEGIASEIASKSFKRRTAIQDVETTNVHEHFIAGRINANEFLTYSQQFGFFAPFTLFLVNGRWVLDPTQPTESTRPPIVAVTHDSGTHEEPITVTLSAHDEVDPNPKVYYAVDGSRPTTSSPFFISLGQVTIDASGTKTLKYFAQNFAGNSSDIKTKTYEMDVADVQHHIRIKDGDPRPGEYSGALTITIEAVDDKDEHVTVYYTLGGSVPDENSPSFRDCKRFEISEKGNHVITCYAKDSCGKEIYKTFYYSIDDRG